MEFVKYRKVYKRKPIKQKFLLCFTVSILALRERSYKFVSFSLLFQFQKTQKLVMPRINFYQSLFTVEFFSRNLTTAYSGYHIINVFLDYHHENKVNCYTCVLIILINLQNCTTSLISYRSGNKKSDVWKINFTYRELNIIASVFEDQYVLKNFKVHRKIHLLSLLAKILTVHACLYLSTSHCTGYYLNHSMKS